MAAVLFATAGNLHDRCSLCAVDVTKFDEMVWNSVLFIDPAASSVDMIIDTVLSGLLDKVAPV